MGFSLWALCMLQSVSLSVPTPCLNVYMHHYMYYCPPWLLHVNAPFCYVIVIWKDEFLCLTLCVSSSHLTCGPTPCLKCTHVSVHLIYVLTWVLGMSVPPHMCRKFHEKHGCDPLWQWVFVTISPFLVHTALLECEHAWVHDIYVHLTPHFSLMPPPLNCYHGKMVCHFVALCVCSQSALLLESQTMVRMYTHASVHQFMSTWLCMSAPPPMNTFMKILGLLCVALCVCHNHYFSWSQTLVRMCTCNSTSIYVHMNLHFILTSLCIITWKDVCPCIAQCEYFSKPTSGPTPWLECVHASGHVFMSTCLPMSPSPN